MAVHSHPTGPTGIAGSCSQDLSPDLSDPRVLKDPRVKRNCWSCWWDPLALPRATKVKRNCWSCWWGQIAKPRVVLDGPLGLLMDRLVLLDPYRSYRSCLVLLVDRSVLQEIKASKRNWRVLLVVPQGLKVKKELLVLLTLTGPIGPKGQKDQAGPWWADWSLVVLMDRLALMDRLVSWTQVLQELLVLLVDRLVLQEIKAKELRVLLAHIGPIGPLGPEGPKGEKGTAGPAGGPIGPSGPSVGLS